ncbi:ExeM/NucH family extracellular endonuclease [Georgenia satyanarayanai]|uniref:ExeM/NucH family extracellular endonuclease n=1 Tax=Georgenia satyanarayanai TaxID=860221 RepID=UPI00203B3C39|nr:ExeM/NucH family extracellular endonuclease [Georgenia satyanarayanai]MCM3660321.1 ExeM/NucH family extracellular endonuclease [Georgenia satyanarayanai]
MAAVGVASLILTPLVAVTPAAALMSTGPVFISEIHYDNDGTDQGEAIEVQAPAGTDLTGWQVVLYNGGNGSVYDTKTLDGTVGESGVVVQEYPENGVQNGGPDGVALIDASGALVEFLSYEGVMTASGGPADGVQSIDIGVMQPGSTPAGQSLQRVDGVWTGPSASSFGAVNSAVEEPGPDPDPEPGAVTPIAEIQGTGDATPLLGQTVTTRGVVTGVYADGGFNGAFIQTPGTGADLEGHDASHGIFVFAGGTQLASDVEVGDLVEVTGTAGEYFGLTQIAAASHRVLDEPAADVVPAQVPLPAVDEREAFEGMLLAPQGAFTVTDTYHTNRFGWVGLAAGDEPLRQPTDVVRPGTEAYTGLLAANADRAIRMDDGSSHDWTNFSFDDHGTPVAYLTPDNPVRVGAPVEFQGPVILDFRRTVAGEDATWNFQPQSRLTGANAAEVQPINWENTRPEAPEEVGGDVRLATFNVLNYFTSLGDEEAGCGFFGDRLGGPTTARSCDVRGAYDAANLARQTEKIVSAVNALDADVVALQEIENSLPFAPGNTAADRDHALSDLVDALNAGAGEERWEYVVSAEQFPAAEDVIRNAFIYQVDAVTPVGGTKILLDSAAFGNAREPMAQEFAPVDENGDVVEDADSFVVINNHFKSKGSGSGENADQGDGQGASNPDRVRQAEALVAFADEVAADAGTELVFLAGDFNSYTQEDPMQVFYENGYTDLGDELTEKSTYSFGSMVGSLDHVLASEAATAAVTGADIWNINAYESIAFEYSRYNYNVTDFHDASPYRSSDHDPIIVGVDLLADEPGPTVDINLLAFNDFHGRLFDYTRDRDTGAVLGNDTLAFAGTIEELRAQEGEGNTILFSSGDNIGASLFTSALQEDKPTIDILNALDLTAATVGNHEFDGGYDNLTGQVTEWADFRHLGANVTVKATGEPALPAYETVEVEGLTVAVIGAVTQETPSLVSPEGIAMLEFGDPVEAVNRVAAALTDGDGANGEADVIVASYHEGAGFDENASSLEEEIASSETFAHIVGGTTSAVDAIFNGHTHKVYAWDGPVPGEEGAFRPVIQGESYGEYVSQVVLTVDRESGDVVDYDHRNVPASTTPMGELVQTYARVAEVKTILDAALARAAEIGNEVVGSVSADITTAFTAAGGRDDRGSESTLGNLVGNALRDTLSAQNLGGAQIGVVNPGGLRADLRYGEDGKITFAEANAVLPFLNDLWTVTLTGAQFKEMLEQQWQPESSSRSFLHLGLSDNVSYTMDPTAERGERITSVTVDGQPLDTAAEYRIGTFSFLAQGGDNFTVFADATDVQQTGLIDRDGWISYIENSSPLSPDFARRATVLTPLPSELVAGEEVSFEVSRLDLTSLGSPDNTELAVYLVGADGERGEAVHTAPVTDGAATVTFTVPGDLDGEYTLEMEAAPSGTTVRVPVTITAADQPLRFGFFLSDDWSGKAHYAFQYGRFTDEVLIGDWDGNGTDTITVRRGREYFVNDAPRGGPATTVFAYGRPDDVVLVGDWDGDGVDTLAVRRGAQYYVKNSLRGGDADRVISYGRANDDVLVGDWDGNGTDTLAVRRGATYYAKNRIAGGDADVVFTYGRPNDVPLAGDWDGNGTDTFAIRRDREFHVKNSLRDGPADFVMVYGRSGDEVYVGDWNGDGKDTLGVRRTPAS